MVVEQGVGDLERGPRREPRAGVALGDLDRPYHAKEAPARGQRARADRLQGEDEGGRAAIHDRQLRRVHVDFHVVDAEARQRGEQVLDGGDAGVALLQRGGEMGIDHVECVGTDHADRLLVHTPEDDARAGRCRAQRHGDELARVQPDARDGRGTVDRGLLHTHLRRADHRASAAGPSTHLSEGTTAGKPRDPGRRCARALRGPRGDAAPQSAWRRRNAGMSR